MNPIISEFELRRYALVHQILLLEDEQILEQLETWMTTLLPVNQPPALPHFVKPIQPTLSLKTLKIEQNYTGFDVSSFSNLSDELEIHEPVEDLLEML